MTDPTLLSQTAAALADRWAPGTLTVTLTPSPDPSSAATGAAGDPVERARLTLMLDGHRVAFEPLVHPLLTPAAAVRLAASLTDDERRRSLIVTGFVRPAVADLLRRAGLAYVDSAGNAHIEHPPLFVHVEGRTRPDGHTAAATAPPTARAFRGDGLKVVFALLVCPELADRSYRDLATLAGVSHGVVQYTVQHLIRLGFLVRLGRTRRRLDRLTELLDRWAVGYTDSLRPKLSLGTYRFVSPDRLRLWPDLPLDPAHDRWGGEPAAALATGYLSPGRLTLYTRADPPELMRRLRLVPDADGSVELVRPFWPTALEQAAADRFPPTATPDVLTYADLLSIRDPRTAEVAALIRERWSERLFSPHPEADRG